VEFESVGEEATLEGLEMHHIKSLSISGVHKMFVQKRLLNYFSGNFNFRSFGENNRRRWLEPSASKGARWVPRGDLDSNVLI